MLLAIQSIHMRLVLLLIPTFNVCHHFNHLIHLLDFLFLQLRCSIFLHSHPYIVSFLTCHSSFYLSLHVHLLLLLLITWTCICINIEISKPFTAPVISILTVNITRTPIHTFILVPICEWNRGYASAHHFVCTTIHICTLHYISPHNSRNLFQILTQFIAFCNILIHTSVFSLRGEHPTTNFRNTTSISRKSCTLFFCITSAIVTAINTKTNIDF